MTTYNRQEDGSYLVERTTREKAYHEAGHVVMAELLGAHVERATQTNTSAQLTMGNKSAALVAVAGVVAMELAGASEAESSASQADQEYIQGWLQKEHINDAYKWSYLGRELAHQARTELLKNWDKVQEIASHLVTYGEWTPDSKLSQERNLAGERNLAKSRDLELELLRYREMRTGAQPDSLARELLTESIQAIEARMEGKKPMPGQPRWTTAGGNLKVQ